LIVSDAVRFNTQCIAEASRLTVREAVPAQPGTAPIGDSARRAKFLLECRWQPTKPTAAAVCPDDGERAAPRANWPKKWQQRYERGQPMNTRACGFAANRRYSIRVKETLMGKLPVRSLRCSVDIGIAGFFLIKTYVDRKIVESNIPAVKNPCAYEFQMH
jgi:hypothetical protein